METNFDEIAGSLGLNQQSCPENQLHLLKTIARVDQKLFNCPRCKKMFRIAGAKESGIYKCPRCGSVLSESVLESAAIIRPQDSELVLDQTIPADVREALRKPQNIIGRYVIISATKAFDVELLRYVTLEFKQIPDALKTLEHKHIAAIYDTGTINSKSYVSRQYVEGTEISPSNPRFLELLCDVCDAVDYAHRKGISHGSLVPHNILIDESGSVLVANFGAHGSASADVESIAALLPEPFRDRKYSSASEIAQKIRAYLSRGPFLKKRRRIVAVLAAACVLALAGGTFGLLNFLKGKEAEEKRSLAEENEHKNLEQKTRMLNALMQDLRKAHVEALERRRAGEGYAALNAIPARILKSPSYALVKESAESDSQFHYSFGRLSRIVGDNSSAGAHQEMAVKLDSKNGLAQYELAFLKLGTFERDFSRARDMVLSLNSRKENLDPTEEEIFQYDPALGQLKANIIALLTAAADNLPKKSDECVASAAIMAILKSDFAGAGKILAGVLPSFEDAAILIASNCRKTGDIAGAATALTKSIAVDKGNTELLVARAKLYIEQAIVQTYSGKDPAENLNRAISDCDEAVRLHPALTEALVIRGNSRMTLGSRLFDNGKNPDKEYVSAIESFDLALKSDASSVEALIRRGMTYGNWGNDEMALGRDPAKKFQLAVEDFDRAIKFRERAYESLKRLGDVHAQWGGYLQQTGRNPSEHYQTAIDCYAKAMEANTRVDIWGGRGQTLLNWGAFLKSIGKDPSEKFAAALECHDKQIERNPKDYHSWMYRGTVYNHIALFDEDNGKSPVQDFLKAVNDFDASSRLNPNNSEIWSWLGGASSNLAAYEQRSGADPSTHYALAMKAFARALKINPRNYDALIGRGIACSNRAEYENNEERGKSYSQAIEDYERAREISPNDIEIGVRLGCVYLNRGLNSGEAGQDPMPDLAKAEEYFTAITKKGIDVPLAWERLAMVRANKLISVKVGVSTHTKSIEELYADAIDAMKRAIPMKVNTAELILVRGQIHFMMDHFKEAVADFEEGARLDANLGETYRGFWDKAKKHLSDGDF